MDSDSVTPARAEPEDSTSDSESELYDIEERLLLPGKSRSRTKQSVHGYRSGARLISFPLTLLNLSLFLATATLAVKVAFSSPYNTSLAMKKTSAYSPVLESKDIPLVDQQVSGAFFPRRDGSDLLGRLEPGPETHAKWKDYEYQRWFAITSKDVRKLGKDPAKTVKFPPEYGLGDDAYMAGLDVFHQIHCLNVLRREAFKDYYWDGEKYRAEMYDQDDLPEREHSELFWVHLRHCTDIILQTLMCHGDTEMITLTWMEAQDNPWPDFNVNKKCRSFEAIKDWRDTHAEPYEKIHALKKPHDLEKVDDRYWKLMGNATHPGNNTHHPWDWITG